LPRDDVAHQVGSGDRHLGFVGGRGGTAEHRAAAVFFEAVGVMRLAAPRTILSIALGFLNFAPAVGAEEAQLRCLS